MVVLCYLPVEEETNNDEDSMSPAHRKQTIGAASSLELVEWTHWGDMPVEEESLKEDNAMFVLLPFGGLHKTYTITCSSWSKYCGGLSNWRIGDSTWTYSAEC